MPEMSKGRRSSGPYVGAPMVRLYGGDNLGGRCAGGCGQLVPAALPDDRHVTCHGDMDDLKRRDKIRVARKARLAGESTP